MSENAEDVISKQQAVLDNFFCLLGIFAYDKAKEFLEKEKDLAVKNHTVAPFFSSALSAFSSLAAAEKNYANFMFLGPKGFLRKESSLKSMYESLLSEYQRLEDRHYITPVGTPSLSPTASVRTPSPGGGSEASAVSSSLSSAGSMRVTTYPGEDVLENLASHLCGQLLCYVRARLRMMEFYEKMYAMSLQKFMKFYQLLSMISETVTSNAKLFHHPVLSPLKTSFSTECEVLVKLLEAELNMQNWRFLPSLLCLHEAHSKLGTWLPLPKEGKKQGASNVYRPPIPTMYNWLRTLKAALVSKFTLYFHEILSKQSPPTEMKNFCAKASFDYFSKITAFQKRYDVACIAIVLDTNGLDDYIGPGYCHPTKSYEAPKGLDSFPPILCYPPTCFSPEKQFSHWPSVVMIMNNKELDIKNTESAISVYDRRTSATYFMAKIESRFTLVFIFESKKTEKDSHIHKFMHSLVMQLRGNKMFSSIKPGSK